MKNPYMTHTREQILTEATTALTNLYLIGRVVEQLPQADAEWVVSKLAQHQDDIEESITSSITPAGDC